MNSHDVCFLIFLAFLFLTFFVTAQIATSLNRNEIVDPDDVASYGNVIEIKDLKHIYTANSSEFETVTIIKDMKIGEVGYTFPWAYDYDTNELRLDFTVSCCKIGTATLRVKRVEEGYKIKFNP